ncbi:MAG: MHS family MFS transporter [Chloroflexi bacterium]|nr:MHS family MFS transporter [Chloroflexota bacterium]MBV9134696.1 MHS family MFS transporter [Chloroflexota bacterium]MBV9893546.1 MHS family MFS transporter [Chloroflexota bacterium]
MTSQAAVVEDPERARHLRRAIIASTVGTTIEWYDYFLYSTVTPLVFASLYFPNSDPLTSQLNAFGVYFVGFIARPIGAAIFGHYGDRIGRKAALIASLLLMGLGTFLVALVPGYNSIGIAGGIILSILRFVQGIGVGGEWGGSVLLSMEWGRHGRRGFNASWPQFGVPAGLLLANLAVLFFSVVAGPDFVNWGWRIPFLLSLILVGVGLWIRLGILETPTFQRLVAERRVEAQPVVEVIKRHPKEIALAALVRLSEQAPFYIFTAFIFTYAVGQPPALGFDRNLILYPVLVASILGFIMIPLFGHLSDLYGRRPVYMAGAALTGIFGFVYFGLLDTRAYVLVFIAIAISLIPHDMQYGPQAAMIAESFPGRLRYSGASIGYQLSSVFAGGPAPLIAVALFSAYRSGYAVAGYILVCAVISLIAAALMRERARVDIAQEFGEGEVDIVSTRTSAATASSP